MGQIRAATPADVVAIAPNLRDADRAEIEAYVGVPASPLLLLSFADYCDRIWALETSEGAVAAILGTYPVPGWPHVGVVWLIGTDHLRTHRVEFLRGCRKHLPEIYGPYDLLTNAVDERNVLHQRWLKWLGFTFTRRLETYGAQGRPFIEFIGIKPEPCAHP
jgi:hypothetical protein